MKRKLSICAALLCALFGCAVQQPDDPPQASPPPEDTPPSVSQPLEEAPPEVPSPKPLTLPVRESPVAVGYGDYYVIRSDGALVMWGRPEFGGDGEDVPFSQAKELLPNAAAAYTSGRGASLAVDRGGGLWACEQSGAWTCEQLLDEAVGADWGETAMLALRPDDSLWLLYRGEDSGVLLG